MSNFLGKKVYKQFEEKDQRDKQQMVETSAFIKSLDKRVSKNAKLKQIPKKDPLRTYSALIEFGDVTAFKTYNKLCALMTGKL